jgi:hypothetical protein
MLNGEKEFPGCVLDDLNLVQGVDDEMSSKLVDLFALVGRAHSDDSSARSYSRLDTTRGVLENHGTFWVDTEIGSGKEERVREGLAALEASIVGSYTDFGDGDACLSGGFAVQDEQWLTWYGLSSRGSRFWPRKLPLRTCPPGGNRSMLGHPGGFGRSYQ